MELIRHPRTLENLRAHSFKKGQTIHYFKVIDSPVGPLTLVASSNALIQLTWGDNEASMPGCSVPAEGGQASTILKLTEKQLAEYFKKKRTAFDIPIAPEGTPFQKMVWLELRNIPYGTFITYGEQATRIGAPKSARAVGAANGRNPISIIVPCHRVVGASGHLTGFAGGLATKKALLELEGAF